MRNLGIDIRISDLAHLRCGDMVGLGGSLVEVRLRQHRDNQGIHIRRRWRLQTSSAGLESVLAFEFWLGFTWRFNVSDMMADMSRPARFGGIGLPSVRKLCAMIVDIEPHGLPRHGIRFRH